MTAAYLRFVADEDVILHGSGDVVHSELQEGPLWDIDQTNSGPGGTAVQWVGPGNHSHSLKKIDNTSVLNNFSQAHVLFSQ